MRNSILILCGKSCAGKDTLLNYIVKFKHYTPIISTTTRPIRSGEVNGVDYYFVTENEFLEKIKNNELIEYRSYETLVDGKKDTWYYGVEKSKVESKKWKEKFVVVLDTVGIDGFIKYFGRKRLKIVYLDIPQSVRVERCIARGDYNESEWNRREKWDDETFKSIKKIADNILTDWDISRLSNETGNAIFWSKIIIAVDFDNTLFITDYPTIKTPIWNVIEIIKACKACGDTVILWTCREGDELNDAIEACKKVGLEFDYINENCREQIEKFGNNSRKISADIYIDDKSLHPLSFLEILEKL